MDTEAFARRHSGTIAAAVAAVAFAAGSIGAYQTVHKPSVVPVLLRQAVENDRMSTYDETPGAGGVLVLLRNDSTTPVEVIDAAFSRTTATPPLYIAPETVAPGAEVNVYVPVPGECSTSGLAVAGNAPPVQIMVSAHRPGAPLQSIPVEITGELAYIMAACHQNS